MTRQAARRWVMGSDQAFEARLRGQPPFASSAASTARPSFVSQSRPAGSRWMRPLTIIAVMPVMPVMTACSQSVSLETQNSRTRSGCSALGPRLRWASSADWSHLAPPRRGTA